MLLFSYLRLNDRLTPRRRGSSSACTYVTCHKKKNDSARPKKRSRPSSGGGAKDGGAAAKAGGADGDGQNEYDSGEEQVENDDDRGFIDSDDDLADIAKEYDEKQVFDDEAPIPEKKARHESEGVTASGSTNIIDIALEASRGAKKKRKDMEESEKRMVVANLLEKMDEAWRNDLDSLGANPPRPALHKLALVGTVEKVLRQRSLHDVMLDDHNILEMVRNWLMPWPIEDAEGNELPLSRRNLPNLTLRTKMYEMLATMDKIRPEHLKGSERGGVGGHAPGLGKVVLMLFKHPHETPGNKRALKNIMEEWSRAIFKKTRVYQNDRGHSNLRVKEVDAGGSSSSSSSSSSSGRGRGGLKRASSDLREDDFLNDGADGQGDNFAGAPADRGRINLPIRTGFNFKVKPKANVIEAVNIGKNTEKKSKLVTKLKDVKRKTVQGSQRGEQPAYRVHI